VTPAAEIGSAPRNESRLRRLLPGAAMSGVTLLLAWAAFPPADLAPLAWVALVPWLILIGRQRPLRAGAWSLALGWAFFLLSIHWIRFVTPPGWIALAFYCGLYWAVAGVGIAWLRTRRVPVLLSAPLLITALELLRSRLLTGFPFIFMGHTQYRFLPIIQVADLAGVYGVSFLVILVNAAIAEGVLSWRRRRALVLGGAAAALLLVVGALTYGMMRLNAYQPRGEVTALLVQANIPQDIKHSNSYEDSDALLRTHIDLTLQSRERPEIILWPETMFPAPINLVQDTDFISRLLTYSNPDLSPKERAKREKDIHEYGAFLQRCREALLEVAQRGGTTLLIGSETNDRETERRYNSAYLLTPQGNVLGRYDKIHLVIFGEYTPLLDALPFLKTFRPPEMGEDLSPGIQRTLLDLPLKSGGTARFGVTICYEDADADLFRRFVRDGAEFMVTLTNDGWFKDSSELDQHLAVSVFRAVENRVGLARDANTGISAIIDPLGRMKTLTLPDGRRREVKGTLLGQVALSNMRSFYTARGDLFGLAVLAASGLLLFAAALRRPEASVDEARDDQVDGDDQGKRGKGRK